jgi:hypothetical protein
MIQKSRFVFNPVFRYYHIPSKNIKTYGFGGELGYLPLDRFELKPGMIYYFGDEKDVEILFTTRYYLLKTKFTIFPQISSSYLFLAKNFHYTVSAGIGYYGIFRRLGIDLIFNYELDKYFIYPFYPTIKIKILLGKLAKNHKS